MNIEIKNKLSESFCVPFSSFQLEKPTLIWVNNASLITKDELENDCSFVKSDNRCFADIKVNFESTKVLYAEQYGGTGTGFNGGGVRCGNVKKFQLKGIGVNQTVGEHNNFDHSSGMYPVFEAVTEAINSVILNTILPVGTIEYLGIIGIGQSSNLKNNVTELAIGVREKGIRPAHFMRAANFKPVEHNREKIVDDVVRTRMTNQKFYQNFTNQQELIQFIGKFLSNTAVQFAFARIYQIAHGAVSPSNITIEGKWLDLTNATFIPSNKNYCASESTVTFYSEPMVICDIVEEWVDGIAKYNRLNLNSTPLIQYFTQQFDAYLLYYIPEFFGLSSKDMNVKYLLKEKKDAVTHRSQNSLCLFTTVGPCFSPSQ